MTKAPISTAEPENSELSIKIIGYLSALSEAQISHQVAAFRRGLSEAGFVEGKNVAIDYRWADGQYDRLPAMAADLARRSVNLIVAQAPPPWPVRKMIGRALPASTIQDDLLQVDLVGTHRQGGLRLTDIQDDAPRRSVSFRPEQASRIPNRLIQIELLQLGFACASSTGRGGG